VNRDGIISRGEWPSDLTTFTRVDANGDGVITRPEYLGEGWMANATPAASDLGAIPGTGPATIEARRRTAGGQKKTKTTGTSGTSKASGSWNRRTAVTRSRWVDAPTHRAGYRAGFRAGAAEASAPDGVQVWNFRTGVRSEISGPGSGLEFPTGRV
jgi:hypothetical protein